MVLVFLKWDLKKSSEKPLTPDFSEVENKPIVRGVKQFGSDPLRILVIPFLWGQIQTFPPETKHGSDSYGVNEAFQTLTPFSLICRYIWPSHLQQDGRLGSAWIVGIFWVTTTVNNSVQLSAAYSAEESDS